MPERRTRVTRPLAALFCAVALATAGCGNEASAGEGSESSGPTEEVTETGTASVSETTELSCGQSLVVPAEQGLTLVGQFPATASIADDLLTGTIDITSQIQLRGTVTPRAEVFLVRDGRIVTLPEARDLVGVEWDLNPGDVTSTTGAAVLVSCDPSAPLTAGAYQLFARVVVTQDGADDSEFFGGPWQVELW